MVIWSFWRNKYNQKGLTPAKGISPNFSNAQNVLADSNNILWIIFGGLWAWLCHIFFGLLLSITIIGLPWGKQHFKMARLSLVPFGKNVNIGL